MDKHEVFIGCGISEEESKRNYQHYNEIKDKVKITNYISGYGKTTYYVEPLDESLTVDEMALVCDKGNLCFGYGVTEYNDGTYKIEVYTD